MIATAIAYLMSACMLVLLVACGCSAFSEKERSKHEPLSLMLAFLFFGFCAWGFARLGGI